MGQASVVMMRDLHTEGDDPVWQLFVSEPRQAATERPQAAKAAFAHSTRPREAKALKTAPRAKWVVPADQLNDDISDLGG
jgi:hypothetical protein